MNVKKSSRVTKENKKKIPFSQLKKITQALIGSAEDAKRPYCQPTFPNFYILVNLTAK